MANVPDLTMTELSAEIKDTDLKTWWDTLDPLPAGVPVCEMFAKLLQAAYVAQLKKNAATTTAQGEALAAYPVPTTTNVQTDTVTGIQFYSATHAVRVISDVNQDSSMPARQ